MTSTRNFIAILALAACGAGTTSAGRPARGSVSAEAEVRAVVDRWARTFTRDSIDAHIALHADSVTVDGRVRGRSALRPRLARAVEFRGAAPVIDVSLAEVFLGDSVARVEPVYEIGTSRPAAKRLLLRTIDGAWKIAGTETVSEMPYERALPGLGDEYLALVERTAAMNLAWIARTIEANPPIGGDPRLRFQALSALDEPLHLRSAPYLASVRDFLRARIDRAIAEIRSERVTDGVTVWKLYNHGWFVKTANHAWAFDLNPGFGDAVMTDAQIDALLGDADALFCSHWHRDHISLPVVRRALAKGIPVLIPPLDAGEGESNVRDVPELARAIVVQPATGGEVAGLRWYAYPGWQETVMNHVFFVEADGAGVLHFGDHGNTRDFPWIDRIGDEHAVDVMLPKVNLEELARTVRGVRPRWIITGHENELGHTFDHRQPYDEAFERLSKVRTAEWRVLTWGERVHVESRGGNVSGTR